MYEICRLLASTAPKVKKPRKPAAKAAKPGAKVELFMNNKEYTLAERDTRFKTAWFLQDENGTRLPYSFARHDFKVL